MSNFTLLTAKAAQIVSDAYGDATLGQITFSSSVSAALTAEDLTHWQFLFWLRAGHAIITYEADRFSPPRQLDGFFLDQLIHPPINKTIDDAFSIVRAAGFAAPVTSVVLRHDINLGPSGSQEPFYRFQFPSVLNLVCVGSATGHLVTLSLPAS